LDERIQLNETNFGVGRSPAKIFQLCVEAEDE